MTSLADTPSSGESEVLATLHQWGGGGHNGLLFARLPVAVARYFHGSDTKSGADATWEADTLTAVQALATAGYVHGVDADDGTTVDLTSGTPPADTRVILTSSGNAYARHPRPRPVAAR